MVKLSSDPLFVEKVRDVAGLIRLAAGPCTTMVFVWSRLTHGCPLFTPSAGGAGRTRPMVHAGKTR